MNYTRDKIKAYPYNFLQYLQENIGNSTFAIIDTGGYFSHVLNELQSIFGSNLIGVVEDTENGHQRYENLLSHEGYDSLPYSVVSVARSALKDPEDHLVGHATLFSAESLLRKCGEILTGKNAIVLGYGKIGRSIAQGLQSRGVRVDVFDADPVRQILAKAHNFHTNKKHRLLEKADLIFCATGNLSIKQCDLPYIKHNAYVFTATSVDDEIEDHLSLINHAVPTHSNNLLIQVADTHFFLCNNGNAVNFMHGGVIGPFIKLVQAELLFSLSFLPSFSRDRVSQISDESKSFIAKFWSDHFTEY